MARIGGVGTLDQYLQQSYDAIQYVADNMDAIKAVAGHLTPVEDLADFQADVTELHAKLGLLVEASELIIRATPAGIDLLIAKDAPAQRLLLGLGSAALQSEDYFAKATDLVSLRSYVDEIKLVVDQLTETILTKANMADLVNAMNGLQDQINTKADADSVNTRISQILVDLADGQYTDTLNELVTQLGVKVTANENKLTAQSTALQSLSTRVTATESGISASAAAVIGLNTQIADLVTGQEGTSSAISSLSSRTSIIEGKISAQSEDLVQLSSKANDALNQIGVQSGAIRSLETRATNTEGEQTSMSNALTALDGRITVAETGLAAQVTATDQLQTELAATKDGITAQSSDITELKSSITGTGNLLPNSAFEVDTHSWSLFSRGSGWLGAQLQLNLDGSRLPPALNVLSLTANGVPSGNAGIRSVQVPISALTRYILSGYLAAENCTLSMEWRLFNGAGDQIDMGVVGSATNTPPANNLVNWVRVYEAFRTPSDAALLQVQLWVKGCNTDSPKVWFLRPQLEEAVGSQSEPSPWVPGINGLEETLATAVNSLTTRVESTEAGLDAQSSSITKLQAQIGDIVDWRVVTLSGSGNAASVGAPLEPSIRQAGAATASVSLQRGLTLVRFAANGDVASVTRFDTYASATERANLAAALNALGPQDGFLLVSEDNHGIKHPDLTTAMERCGALNFASITGSVPYALRGAGGIGKGGGIEVYPTNGNAWIDFTFSTVNGMPKGLGEQNAVAGVANAVTQLDARVTNNEGQITTLASSQTNLSARTDTAEGALLNSLIIRAQRDALIVNQVNNMDTRLTSAETEMTAAANTVSGYDTRLTAVEGTVTSQSDNIANLQNSVSSLDSKTTATNNSLATLTSRVSASEGAITSQGSSITSLQSSVAQKARVFVQGSVPSGQQNGDIWVDTSNYNKLKSWNGSAWVEASAQGVQVFAQSSQPTAKNVGDLWFNTGDNNRQYRWNGSSWVEVTDPRTAANASAISSLSTTVSNQGGQITAQAQSITSLSAANASNTTAINSEATARANADNALSSRIDSVQATANSNTAAINSEATARANGDNANANLISNLTTTVNGHTATITSQQNSLNGVLAKAGVTTDVNGYVTGWSLNNNGSYGSFDILANKFSVVNPSDNSKSMYYENGNLVVSGYVKGSLLNSSAFEMGSTYIHTGGGRLAPFVVRDSVGINGGTSYASRTVQLDNFVSPNLGNGYYWKRFAAMRMDVWIEVLIATDAPSDGKTETIVIEVCYDNSGTWTQIISITSNASYKGFIPAIVRYTTVDSWTYCSFRARTTQGNTVAINLKVEVLNFNQSGNAAGSSSGMTGATTAPPATPPTQSYCVDYETTVLPDGRYVRDLVVGDMVETVDVVTGAREWTRLRAMDIGTEDCYRVWTRNGEIIQSKSTPMTMRDGSILHTPDLGGKELLSYMHSWQVAEIEFIGPRKVVKLDFGDRMFFAGTASDKTLATHNRKLTP